MAIFDALLTVSDGQAVTSTAVSTNTIDKSQARDLGEGEQLFMLFTVTEAATASGAATVTFGLIESASSDLSSATTLASTAAIGKASLTVGAQFAIPIPPQIGSKGLRYLGTNYTVATGPLTAGKFHATITRNIGDAKKFYPAGYSVS